MQTRRCFEVCCARCASCWTDTTHEKTLYVTARKVNDSAVLPFIGNLMASSFNMCSQRLSILVRGARLSPWLVAGFAAKYLLLKRSRDPDTTTRAPFLA